MKKVLLVNKYFYPDIGGVETVVAQHADFIKNDSSVIVLCVHKHLRLKTVRENINNVNVIRCSSFGTFFSMPISISFIFYYLFYASRSDVVVHHAPFPLCDFANYFLPRIFIKKLIIFWHSDIIKQKKLKRIINIFVRRTCNKADLIVTTSERLLEFSKDLKPYANKVKVIPLSVDLKNIQHSLNSRTPSKVWDFIFLGRLCYYKGVDIILQAIELLNKQNIYPRILFVGSGDLSQKVTDFIHYAENGNNLSYIDYHVSEIDKYNFISSSRCFLFPSVATSEAFGITQLEAMSLSVPVINTNLNSGVPTVSIHNVTGLTVTPGDAEDLALAMKAIYFDEELTKTFSINARIRVAQYYDDEVISKKIKETLLS